LSILDTPNNLIAISPLVTVVSFSILKIKGIKLRLIGAVCSFVITNKLTLAKYFNVNSDWLMGISDERGICLLNERLQNVQEKHLILSDEQISLLLSCLKIQQIQSKLLIGEENIQLNDIEVILKDYMGK